jgi:uncharacterized YigZ family protein
MKTVKCDSVNEIIIKNSRFITLLISCFDDTDINKIFEEVKIKYPKATHYCYAFITESRKKSSDDGEPGGTAGMPMLNVLEKEGFINVLAITVRYFGGIKLGAGGLVRAYSKSVRDAILGCNKVEVVKGVKVRITISYDMQKNLDYTLRDYNIVNKVYDEKVTYTVLLPNDKLDLISDYDYVVVADEFIEKV